MKRRMISADCHIGAPYELVNELPEKYREYYPRLELREDGVHVVQPEIMAMAAMMMGMADNSASMKVDVKDERRMATGAVGNVCPGATASFDPAVQVADLERDGVYGAVLFGRISDIPDCTPAEADIAYFSLVNDWAADTYKPYLDRIAPGIVLPFKDVAASVKELERCAAKGLRPAILPDGIYKRGYYMSEWEPLWEAANALNVPISMHVGGLRQPPEAAMEFYPGRQEIGWYSQCCLMGETLGWMAYSGIFERYPNLHVVMTEGYAAWLAFAIQFFDHHWDQSRLKDLGVSAMLGAPKIDAPPGMYLRRQTHATFMWDPAAIRLRDITGPDCLMWSNDYPHYEGSFPNSQDWVARQFAGVPEDEIDQMVRGNASRVFGIKVDRTEHGKSAAV